MRVEHVSIDGSVVSIDADADLQAGATATGWVIVPSLRQAHPFTVSPPGHSAIVEETVRENAADLEIGPIEDYSTKGGQLRITEVRMPTATGDFRTLTVGAWESENGCLSTSLVGSQTDRLVEVFDTVNFSARRGGLAFDSPVTTRPREPAIVKNVPGVGVLDVKPAIASVLEHVPRQRGHATTGGELFRYRESSNALMLVTDSAVVALTPTPEADGRELLAVAENLRVEWSPRAGR